MTITPLKGYVLIEAIDPAEIRSAIVIPDSVSRDEHWGGRIVAVAASYDPYGEVPMESRAGHYAVFKPRSADVLSIAGKRYFSVHEDDLLGTFESIDDFQHVSKVG